MSAWSEPTVCAALSLSQTQRPHSRSEQPSDSSLNRSQPIGTSTRSCPDRRLMPSDRHGQPGASYVYGRRRMGPRIKHKLRASARLVCRVRQALPARGRGTRSASRDRGGVEKGGRWCWAATRLAGRWSPRVPAEALAAALSVAHRPAWLASLPSRFSATASRMRFLSAASLICRSL